MKKSVNSKVYNTNLAAEFYILSMLHRKGANAYLTLGNKKSVDIIIKRTDGSMATIDVKGLAGKTCWPMDNFKEIDGSHFIVFISFLGKIEDHNQLPECWVIPSPNVSGLLDTNPIRTRIFINRSGAKGLIKNAERYKEAWGLIVK